VEKQHRALADSFTASPYARFLGLTVVDLASGFSRVTMVARPEYHNFSGTIHGGAIMSLADHAFGCALNTLPGNYVAVQLDTQFIGPPRDGEVLTAEGRVTRAGRKAGLAEVVVTGEDGRTISRSLGTTVPLEPFTKRGGEES
jgi:uncharacterized protein (TIGR00369 family)